MDQPSIAVDRSSRRTDRIESRAETLLADCRRAFHAFGVLDELAENLRILSLNAELAAGRAGDKGKAVRALTQYTRELVNRLAQIQGEMHQLHEETSAHSSTLLRTLMQLRLFERTDAEPAKAAFVGLMTEMVECLDRLADSVADLAHRTRAVEEVISQSDSIATNIAIEASAAGAHEKEFRTVSDTMRRYVEELRQMIDEASDAVRRASEQAESLRRGSLDALDELKRNI